MEANNSSTGAMVPSLSGFMSIKLDITTYPLSLAQIVPILKNKNFMGFLDGTDQCPPEFKRDKDGKSFSFSTNAIHSGSFFIALCNMDLTREEVCFSIQKLYSTVMK